MMERFTPDARQAVAAAREEAVQLHHGFIGCEHLLLALAGAQDSPAAAAIAAFGLGVPALRERVTQIIGRGDQALDADALASLGIDLDTVRQAAEASFGRGALDRIRGRRGRVGLGECVRLTPRARKSLELALRAAVKRNDREISTGHLLLGVIHQGNNAALQVLKAEGVQAGALGEEVTRRMAAAA
jgi:ATP-dependent Clp protease ATP-binding subunit ClpA